MTSPILRRIRIILKLGNISVSTLSESLNHTAIWIGSESGDILKVLPTDNGFVVNSMNAFFPHFFEGTD